MVLVAFFVVGMVSQGVISTALSLWMNLTSASSIGVISNRWTGNREQIEANSALTVVQSAVILQTTNKSMSPTGRFVVVIEPKKNHRLVGTWALIRCISS